MKSLIYYSNTRRTFGYLGTVTTTGSMASFVLAGNIFTIIYFSTSTADGVQLN